MKQIPYGHQEITSDDIEAVTQTLTSDYLTQGPKITEFENKLAKYTGAKYALVFNSGTAALHAAYFSLGLRKDDQFITTPNTFVATSNAGLYLDAKPIFVDVELKTGNIDVNKIEALINKKSKLITPVHYAGNPVDLESLQKIAQKHNLFIVEDACHALGAEYQNTKVGSCAFSDITVFSFHPVKHITTGEGGAITTNNKQLYEKMLMFRTHGITKNNFQNTPHGDWYYEMHFLGFNYRMTDIQAALGISQLKKIDDFVKRRKQIVEVYNNNFGGNSSFDIPVETPTAFSSYHLYPIRLKKKLVEKKRDIFNQMRQQGLGVQVHYIPVYLQPFYRQLGFKEGLCPNAEDFYQSEISLPIYQSMTDEQIDYVIKTVVSIFKKMND